MVRIRFTRMGRKNRPFYRIAVFDLRTRRDGRYIENLGTYDPLEKEPSKKVKLKKDRYAYWISVGAKPSLAVKNILCHTGALKEADEAKLST